jgi:hypothetical protein
MNVPEWMAFALRDSMRITMCLPLKTQKRTGLTPSWSMVQMRRQLQRAEAVEAGRELGSSWAWSLNKHVIASEKGEILCGYRSQE